MSSFKSLALHALPARAGYFEPNQELPAQVREQNPAILVMTDLRQQIAITIEPNVSIDWALQHMKTGGVRLLLVVSPAKEVLGLITSTDIQGEKPLKFRQHMNLRHEEIMVRDIMTPHEQLEVLFMGGHDIPHEQLEVLFMPDVLKSSVGDIVATLQSVGRHHALVLDEDPRSCRPAIRGIFSVSQIARQLNRPIHTSEVAHTFAEVEVALNN